MDRGEGVNGNRDVKTENRKGKEKRSKEEKEALRVVGRDKHLYKASQHSAFWD